MRACRKSSPGSRQPPHAGQGHGLRAGIQEAGAEMCKEMSRIKMLTHMRKEPDAASEMGNP